MPRIEEYGTPTVEGQVPLEVSSRPLDEAGQRGRMIQRFGSQVEGMADAHYRRVAQEEVSDAQVEWAGIRADQTAKLNESIANGSVDTKQMMEDFQTQIDDASTKYQTDHGRQAFNRQAALTKGMLLKTGLSAEAHIAGETAKANLQRGMGSDSSTLLGNPSAFMDVYHANMDAIDAQVETGSIPAALAPKLKNQFGAELAKSAIRGWATLDPEKAEQMLNGTPQNGMKGAWDDLLKDGDAKFQMQREIHEVKRARDADEVRQAALEEKAKKQRSEAWKVDHAEALENNTLSTRVPLKALQNGDITYPDFKEQIAMIEHNAKEKVKSNPQLTMELHSRIFLPNDDPRKISDISQIDEFAAKGLLSIGDRTKLVREMDNTPQGQARRAQKKVLLDYMRTNLVKEDKMINMPDPEGAQHYSNALEALNQREQQMQAQGKPVTDLYNPDSKDSFYGQALAFKRSPKDIMKANMDRAKQQNQAKDAVNNADKTKATLPRLPGESPEAWTARKNKAAVK